MLSQIDVSAFKMAKDMPPRRIDIRVPFGDGVYRFLLGTKEMTELERTCGHTDAKGNLRPTGILAIFGRLARGRAISANGDIDWSRVGFGEALAGEVAAHDIAATIRLGLIGGGEGEVDGERVVVDATRARQLMELYVVGQPLDSLWTLAFAILGVRIHGRAPDPETGL